MLFRKKAFSLIKNHVFHHVSGLIVKALIGFLRTGILSPTTYLSHLLLYDMDAEGNSLQRNAAISLHLFSFVQNYSELRHHRFCFYLVFLFHPSYFVSPCVFCFGSLCFLCLWTPHKFTLSLWRFFIFLFLILIPAVPFNILIKFFPISDWPIFCFFFIQ